MSPQERKDILWICIVSTLILIWGSIPTWAGYRAETSELKFRGLYYDSQDYAAHIAMMEAGAHGEWTYQFRFTTEPMRPAYVRIFYLVLGHISRALGLPAELTFELARWLFGFAALFALYRLMRQLFPDRFWARTAFLLAAVGSGLGWLQLIFSWTSTQITPIDFWLIDAYIFFSLSVFPHFAFVTAATCLVLSLWLDYLELPNTRNIIWIILITLLVQLTNPIAFAVVDVAFLGGVLFAWWNAHKIEKTHVIGLVVLGTFQIPVLAYNVLTLSQDALWSQYTSQHQTLSPPLDYYIWGFAPFLPFAILGVFGEFRERSVRFGTFACWLFAAILLAYAPLYTQQRFLQNITIPLAVLATFGLIRLFDRMEQGRFAWTSRRNSLVLLFVFMASISSVQLSLGRAAYLQMHPDQFYYPASLDAAIQWLRNNAKYNDFVLASAGTSQVLAQKAGVAVYGGHEMETLNYATKNADVRAFFEGRLPKLAKLPIKWVIYGPEEKAINPDFAAPDNLVLAFETPDVKIYQVK